MSDTRYRIREDVSFREVEDELLVISPQDDELYTFNGVGRMLWEHLSAGKSVAEMALALVATYQIDAASAQVDAAAFVESLLAHGLIEEI
jgi:hypothetical protein